MFNLGNYGNSGAGSLQDTINTDMRQIHVKTMRLDDILEGVDEIHVIKIDVEGAEYSVLAGGGETIRRHRPVLIMEMSDEQFTGNCGHATKDVVDILERYQYSILTIENEGLQEWNIHGQYRHWYSVVCIGRDGSI